MSKLTDQGMVVYAIRHKEVLAFGYKDFVREVEPHILGDSKGEGIRIFGWQTLSGKDGRVGWGYYPLASLTSLRPTGKYFVAARPDYDRDQPGFERIIFRL